MEQQGAELVVVSKFLGTVGGEAEMEVSGWLGDYFRTRRLRSIAKTIVKTQEILSAARIDPRSVPLKTLSPLLEGAAQEDDADDDMIGRWAALLARASSGESEIPPHFPLLLTQLTGGQAKILDGLSHLSGDQQDRIGEIGFEYADLARLELVDIATAYPDLVAVKLTPLGRGLVRLCSPPQFEG